MNGAHNHREATTPFGVNWSVKSWKEAIRLTMVKQEAVFQYQLEELHRIYRKQVELKEELEGLRKRVKKLKLDLEEEMVNFNELTEVQVQVGKDMDAPATPETTNSSMARGKQVLREEEHDRSAAGTLVAMSSSLVRASSDRLLWFAKIVTSVRRDADMASVRQRTRLTRMPGVFDLASGQQRTRQMQMLGQHSKCQAAKRPKGTYVVACIGSWGKIKNGRRSKRVRACDPSYTFKRGAFLCRWR